MFDIDNFVDTLDSDESFCDISEDNSEAYLVSDSELIETFNENA